MTSKWSEVDFKLLQVPLRWARLLRLREEIERKRIATICSKSGASPGSFMEIPTTSTRGGSISRIGKMESMRFVESNIIINQETHADSTARHRNFCLRRNEHGLVWVQPTTTVRGVSGIRPPCRKQPFELHCQGTVLGWRCNRHLCPCSCTRYIADWPRKLRECTQQRARNLTRAPGRILL